MRLNTVYLLLVMLILGACSDSTGLGKPAMPVFDPLQIESNLEQLISLSCTTSGVSIYYTLNGEDPDNTSFLYTNPLVLRDILPYMLNTVKIKACAFKADLGYSKISSYTYRVNYPNSVQNLVIMPDHGAQELGTELTMTADPADAKIFYTLDGSEPSPASNLYRGPLHIAQAGFVTVRAIACKEDWNPYGPVERLYVVDLSSPPMVRVEEGSFSFHGVQTSVESFYIDTYEVSQGHYYAVMGASLLPEFQPVARDMAYPVYYVSWFDAVEYCNYRSMLEGFVPCYSYSTLGNNDPRTWPENWNSEDTSQTRIICNLNANGYRLPSEAEWTFAARGGNYSHDWVYSGHEFIDPCGWYDHNSGNTSHAQGMRTPNELGIYDMTGNLGEWCWDAFFGKELDARIIKGGNYHLDSLSCTISSRASLLPADHNSPAVGFRVVRR